MSGPSRRAVLRGLVGAAGGTLAGSLLGPGHARAAASRSRVAVITDGRMWVGPGWNDADLDPARVRAVVARALMELTSATDDAAALRTLIAAVADASQRYGIKVNCVNSDLPSHPTVTAAVADLLVTAGARPENITVFDREEIELASCGYPLGANSHYNVTGNLSDGVGYSSARVELSDGSVALTSIITSRIDHLINIPVLKHHQMAGVTLALKNHFGSIDQPSSLHGRDNDGCPGIAELNAHPLLTGLTRLVLTDATFATFESGLGGKPDFAPMTIIAATDPVAADVVGKALIDERRARAGLPALNARHLAIAGELGLGCADPAAIDRIDVVLSPAIDKPKPWVDAGGCSASARGAAGTIAAAAVAAAAIASRQR